jgi:hypothetical protein
MPLGTASANSNTVRDGTLCHHYFNLRHNNMSRDDALRLLSQRYETQRQFR